MWPVSFTFVLNNVTMYPDPCRHPSAMFLSVISCDYGPLNAGHDDGMERHDRIDPVRLKYVVVAEGFRLLYWTLSFLSHCRGFAMYDVRCRVPAAIATVLEKRSQTEQPAVGATWGGS
ncbi:hypothetical protein K439DRAFT_1621589 [Ramaria rubella]|nr:hypothetical protein K439DRAFT_1621589 [Ramaria rubella]